MRVLNSAAACAAGAALAFGAGISAAEAADPPTIQHVLLISIDGMHALDFINCARGAGGDEGDSYCPNLARLKQHGVSYLDTQTSKPSDSFPGLMSIVTGGSPRTLGVYYDVAFDRALAPPMSMTGNGLSGGTCTPGVFNGTSTEYEEGIDQDQTWLNGIATVTVDAGGFVTNGPDGGVSSIDSTKLPRDPARGCAPVYPWNFIRINTVFGVIHAAGGYTAWSDKHPAYASVSRPNTGSGVTGGATAGVPQNLDDFYGPEINSVPIALPFPGCSAGDDPNFANLGAYTDSFAFTRCYDTLKVNGILNQIDGFTHNRSKPAKVPTIFGMNFQAVSVGQKLIEGGVGSGGYLDSTGAPSPVLRTQIRFVDDAIGKFVTELDTQGLSGSTLLIITAKHGQSPVDSARYTRITPNASVTDGTVTTSPSRIVDACLPDSESNAGNQIGPTEDDVSLLWLKKSCNTADQVALLEQASPAAANIAGIGQIFSGSAITQMFNAPGWPPHGDSRSPDIVVTPNIGVTYSKSTAKQAEHGGFAHDDTNVMLLLSNPALDPKTVTSSVQTMQVAPTILKALRLSPSSLQGVQREGTQALPGLPF